MAPELLILRLLLLGTFVQVAALGLASPLPQPELDGLFLLSLLAGYALLSSSLVRCPSWRGLTTLCGLALSLQCASAAHYAALGTRAGAAGLAEGGGLGLLVSSCLLQRFTARLGLEAWSWIWGSLLLLTLTSAPFAFSLAWTFEQQGWLLLGMTWVTCSGLTLLLYAQAHLLLRAAAAARPRWGVRRLS